MHLASPEIRQLLQRTGAMLIRVAQDRERHQYLIRVQAWVLTPLIGNLRFLDGFDHALRNQLDIVVNPRQILGHIQQQVR